MTDRELLEAAARAAGIKIDKSPYNGGGHGNTGFDAVGDAMLDWHNNKRWNPLRDDGDALRLAVKLFLFVDTAAGAPDSFGAELVRAGNEVVDFVEPRSNCDPYAATRLAIVRAAAAIGAHKEGA